jgi:hypothetical protein
MPFVKVIQSAQFIALFCDEVTTIDNGSWICMIHVYVVDGWIEVPILVRVERIVDISSSNNLTEIILVALLKGGGLTKEKLSKKPLCFKVDGVSFSGGGGGGGGGGIRVTKQIKDSWVVFFMGVHCIAHRANLVVQSLKDLPQFLGLKFS